MQDELTIIVPTHNRPDFLRRLLLFFSQTRLRAGIRIIDSSAEEGYQQNELTIASRAASLQLTHVRDASGIITKCRRAMESVTTPYTVFCADDDFLIPESAGNCVDFLSQHADHCCATGSWASVKPLKKNRTHQTRCFAVDDEDPLVRFEKFARNWFPTFYCVFRTDALLKAWQVTDAATDYDRGRVFPEILLSMLAVLYGKMAVLPQLHLLFELHGDNAHYTTPLLADSDAQHELYEMFESALAHEIATTTGASIEQSTGFVMRFFDVRRHELSRATAKSHGLARIVKNVKNQVYLIRDRVVDDPVDVWLRRRLPQSHRLCQAAQWKLAYRLATEFPHGMTCGAADADSVTNNNFAAA